MAGWERLTPEGGATGYFVVYYHHTIGIDPHELTLTDGPPPEGPVHTFGLNPAELDALATKSEKVRALALIARECLALMRLRTEQDAGLGRDRVMERACDVLEKELAPFEEVTNV